MAQDIGTRLEIAIIKQVEKIEYFLSAEKISPNLAVHEIRKSFKRIRALLKFYYSAESTIAKETSKQFSELGKAISTVRDSYIVVQLFERLANDNKLISERKLKSAKDKLAEKNRLLVQNSFTESESRYAILNYLQNFKLKLSKEIVYPGDEKIVGRLNASYTKSYNYFNRSEFSDYFEILHQLRKRLKVLWYQMEFVKFINLKYFTPKAEQLHKITEQLGEDHDFFIFLTEINNTQLGLYQTEIEILRNQVQHLRDLSHLKLMPRLKQFLSETPEVFGEKMGNLFRE
ncbi:MAG: CHAD domain-containing protein [Bacteroidota bacterium]